MTQDASTTPTPDEEWVQEQLRSLPQPVMPAEVAARISAALQAEQQGQASVTGASDASDAATVTPISGNRRRGLMTGLAVAASVAMALMLLAWTPWQTSPDAYDRVVALTTVRPVSTDTDYTAANIEQAVSANLSDFISRKGELPPASDAQRRGSFAANDEVMASCLDGLGTAPADVRLVDLADYQGQPAGIVVFGDDEGNLVVVVAPRCGRDDPGVRMQLSTRAVNAQP
jgi:hypothetical protein